MAAEKAFKYTAKIKQPQTVAGIKLSPNGGTITERQFKTLKKDAYGSSLLNSNLLVVEAGQAAELVQENSDTSEDGDPERETVPDFDNAGR